MVIDDLNAFDAALYGAPLQSTVDYVQNQFQQGWETLTDAGRSFMEQRKTFMEEATSENTLAKFKAMGRRIRHAWDTDDIKHMSDIGDFQQARTKAVRWLMADPVIRKLAQKQQIEAWAGTYQDTNPDDIGWLHYDYRRVTDGVLMVDEEDKDSMVCTNYVEPYLYEEDELDLQQQSDILSSWENQRAYFEEQKEDFSSKCNSHL